jgi:hypothetical protein
MYIPNNKNYNTQNASYFICLFKTRSPQRNTAAKSH